MSSTATTVAAYLDELAPERREVVQGVLDLVRGNLPDGYQESIGWGMITWSVPLTRYPTTYNAQPLSYLALTAQKRHYALYLMGVYADADQERELRERWTATGRRLDMGKSCLRFQRLDDLDQDLLAELIASTPVDVMIERYERSRAVC